jgi:ribosome-associated translation inhibitor RaiA
MRNRLEKLLNYAYEEIDRVAPDHGEIDVDVYEDGRNHFMAKIKVKINNKIFVARKDGRDMYECFHKALKAFKAKIAKNKSNHKINRDLIFH